MGIGTMTTLHEELTRLLMDAGCSVTKTGIDELVRFISSRDESTIQKIIKDNERTLERLQNDEYMGTRTHTL